MRLILCAGMILFCVAITTISVSGASFTVDQIVTDESGNVSPGDVVRVSARFSFDPSGEVTFPGSDRLELSTALTNPEWQYTLTVDNHPVQTFSQENGVVFINGYYLEYAQGRSEYLSVEVSGVVPVVPDGTIDALTITQYDEFGNVRGDGTSTVPLLVDTRNEPTTPEETSVPETTAPLPTATPLNGAVIIGAIASVVAGIRTGKKED
jgi:hypothetical protein